MTKNTTLACLALCLIAVTPSAQEGIDVQVIAKATTSWDGSPFSYPEGQAQISVVKITIGEGAALPMHCHPVPLAAYVNVGSIEVTKANGEQRRFDQGEALIEVSEIWHFGRGLAPGTELIAFYAGSTDLPISVADQDHGVAGHCPASPVD